MKKKSFLIIFMAIMMSIFPSFSASAFTGNDETEYPDFPTTNKTDNYILLKKTDGTISLIFHNDTYFETIGEYNNSIVWDNSYYFNFGGFYTSGKSVKIYLYNLNTTNNSWVYKGYDEYGVSYTRDNFGISGDDYVNDPTIVTDYLKDIIIDTNINFFFRWGGKTTLVYSPEIEQEEKEYLTYNSNLAEDLEGTSFYNVRFNANNYNSNYQYLIKTQQETEWTNITELLNNEAFQYDYMLYYNTTLYMQVLDENNEILETKTYTISDLGNYGFNISHGFANDLLGREIEAITIDTRTLYSSDYTYQYSYDNQTFYNMNITEDNKVFILNHALNIPLYLRVLNAGNNVIHEQLYDENFENLDKNIHFVENANIVNNKKQIEIEVNFNDYAWFQDVYNFRFFVEGIEYSENNSSVTLISTEDNYIKGIDVKIMVDNKVIEEYTYRVGTISGTGGGSDTSFDNMYDNILENELNNNLQTNDYTTISGMIQAVRNFINAISTFVTTFFELIMYFFNKLNVWIRTCIITLFVELVIFKIIKAVRK